MAETLTERAREHRRRWLTSGIHVNDSECDMADEKAAFARELLEEAERIVDTEEELDGDPPAELLKEFNRNPVESMRATVRATKQSIARRIRQLTGKGSVR